MELREHLMTKFGSVETSEEGFALSIDKMIDYVLFVYVKRESDPDMILSKKKDRAIIELGIKNLKDMELLRFNRSRTLSRIVTEVLHVTATREFELYITALEAATILLDVVRRPIDDTLEDEKWLSALKAKKLGWNDARELLESANGIADRMLGVKETDLEEHAEAVIFKGGIPEKLAQKNAGKK